MAANHGGFPPLIQVGEAYGGRGPVIIGIAWTGLIISTVLVVGRVYLRMKNGGQQGKMQDAAMWFAIASWVGVF